MSTILVFGNTTMRRLFQASLSTPLHSEAPTLDAQGGSKGACSTIRCERQGCGQVVATAAICERMTQMGGIGGKGGPTLFRKTGPCPKQRQGKQKWFSVNSRSEPPPKLDLSKDQIRYGDVHNISSSRASYIALRVTRIIDR